MADLRDWLQLFRSHTSPLEMTITTAGAALAVGTVWDPIVLLYLIFGWFYHNSGYGHNSVEDWISGYDRNDPHKTHHPLQRGVISSAQGRRVTLMLIAATLLYGGLISDFSPLPTILLVTAMAAGFIYNYLGKTIRGKFIPIAIAHSLLFPFAYFGAGGGINWTGSFPFFRGNLALVTILGTAYLLLQITYQIMIEGDLKDIDMDEASFLKKMGVTVSDGLFKASVKARAISSGIKSISVVVLLWICYDLEGNVPVYIVIAAAGILMLYMDRRLMGEREWDHSHCLRDMALMEVLSTFSILLALIPRIGWIPAFAVMVFMLIYFVVVNRFLWNTIMKPMV
jgi:1,4-dihydroxy-2-naphthoate octaprenyltransferase